MPHLVSSSFPVLPPPTVCPQHPEVRSEGLQPDHRPPPMGPQSPEVQSEEEMTRVSSLGCSPWLFLLKTPDPAPPGPGETGASPSHHARKAAPTSP